MKVNLLQVSLREALYDMDKKDSFILLYKILVTGYNAIRICKFCMVPI